RLVTRLIDASSGRIGFAGKELGAIPAARFARVPERARIQMVFQDAGESLNPRFTAFQAIVDPLRRLTPLRAAALAGRVHEAAGLAGLPEELLGRFPHQLSGRQKARVGIPRPIAVDPRLVILAAPAQHQFEVGGAERALAGLVDDRLAGKRRQLGDDFPARLAAHQDAAARTRVADAGADTPRAPALVFRKICEIGAMSLAGVED